MQGTARETVRTRLSPRPLPRSTWPALPNLQVHESWKRRSRENSDDRDYNDQLNQRETLRSFVHQQPLSIYDKNKVHNTFGTHGTRQNMTKVITNITQLPIDTA